ncbi:MAG: hypothetical protein PVF77_18225, partial [Anaerolineae bacterium]
MKTSKPRRGQRTAAAGLRTSVVILALIVNLLPFAPLAQTAHAAGGAYTLNFAAADPSLYIPPIPF